MARIEDHRTQDDTLRLLTPEEAAAAMANPKWPASVWENNPIVAQSADGSYITAAGMEYWREEAHAERGRR